MMYDSIEQLERSSEVTFNKSIFSSVYNDVIIYVEDTARANVYEVLLNRLLDQKIRFENIYLSGGKDKVKEFYQMHKENPDIPRFFIVDLDFDLLLEKEIIQDENFLYLRRYSIENYLVDELCGIFFLNSRLSCGEEKSREMLNFHSLIEYIQNEYQTLNAFFLAIQKLDLNVQNTKLSIEQLIKDKSWEFEESKVEAYKESAIQGAIQEGLLDEFLGLVEQFELKQAELYNDNLWEIIPGKQFIAIFAKYIVSFCGKKKQYYLDDIYSLGARESSIESLVFLKEALENYLSSQVSRIATTS